MGKESKLLLIHRVFLVAKESQWYAAKIFIRADSLETEVKFMQKVGQCKYVV